MDRKDDDGCISLLMLLLLLLLSVAFRTVSLFPRIIRLCGGGVGGEREIENRSSTSNQNQMSHTQICRTRRSESEETDRVAGTVNDWNSFSVSRSS